MPVRLGGCGLAAKDRIPGSWLSGMQPWTWVRGLCSGGSGIWGRGQGRGAEGFQAVEGGSRECACQRRPPAARLFCGLSGPLRFCAPSARRCARFVGYRGGVV